MLGRVIIIVICAALVLTPAFAARAFAEESAPREGARHFNDPKDRSAGHLDGYLSAHLAGHLDASMDGAALYVEPEARVPYTPAGRRLLNTELRCSKAVGNADVAGAALPEYGGAGSSVQPAGPGDHQATGGTLATCTVTSTADSGSGSLRACLLQAAADGTILFDAGVFPQASPAAIVLASALPALTMHGLTIDGSNAGVVLDGSGLSVGAGLVVSGAGSVTS